MPTLPPSGEQIELRHLNQQAVVVEVGGGLRAYAVDGQPVLDGYPVDRMADGGRGQPLLPWPNRLEDGAYTFDARRLQVPIDDVTHRNANHGLTRWRTWTIAERAPDRVRLHLQLYPQPGYPFTLELSLIYTLGPDGLQVETRATNRGQQRLPFGAGFHPYFTVGTPFVDEAELQIAAQHVLEVDPERMLPTGRSLPTAGSELDFGQPRLIGSTVLDRCFAQLGRDAEGRAQVSLRQPATGRTVRVWLDATFRYVQLYTGETLAPERRRRSLAIEPMTCPPNAFRTGTDLLVLEPEASRAFRWGVAVGGGI